MAPVVAIFSGGVAAADVTAAAPDGFVISHGFETQAEPAAAWAALVDVAGWWSPDHTYSGDAAALSLEPVAGGCWCEHWAGGSVEHARVLAAAPDRLLRLQGGFGPLQALAVEAVLTVEMTPVEGGVGRQRVSVDYVVSGSSLSKLDAYAGPVDQVLGEQVDRLAARLADQAPVR